MPIQQRVDPRWNEIIEQPKRISSHLVHVCWTRADFIHDEHRAVPATGCAIRLAVCDPSVSVQMVIPSQRLRSSTARRASHRQTGRWGRLEHPSFPPPPHLNGTEHDATAWMKCGRKVYRKQRHFQNRGHSVAHDVKNMANHIVAMDQW